MATVLDVQHQVVDRTPHRRNKSGELDVFDAASYFSGEERWRMDSSLQTSQASRMDVRRDRQGLPYTGGSRQSVDATPLSYQTQKQKALVKKGRETKSKTPAGSAPVSKLANFLNSLFNSTESKKKPKENNGVEEIPSGGRRRRSSIGHLQSISDNTARSLYSYPSPSSGFEPTLSLNTKIYEEINSCLATPRAVAPFPPINGVFDEKRCTNIAWLEQRLQYSDTANALKTTDVYVWKGRSYDNDDEMRMENKIFERDEGKIGDVTTEKIVEFRKKKNRKSQDRDCLNVNVPRKMDDQVEDGFESDSDLFEIRSFDLKN